MSPQLLSSWARVLFFRASCALLVLAAASLAARAEPPDLDPFSDANQVPPRAAPAAASPRSQVDPFSEANKEQPTRAVEPPAPAPAKATKEPPTAKRIDFEVDVTPKEARRGETVKVTITGIPKPGFHTYPITQRASNPQQDPSGLSKLTFEATPGLKPLWPITESPPVAKQNLDSGIFLEFDSKFSWSQDVLILPDAEPGPKTLRFRVKLAVCNEGSCANGEHVFEKTVNISSEPAVPLTAQLQERLAAKPPALKVVPVADTASKGTQTAPNSPATRGTNSEEDNSLWSFLVVSMGAALFMLFTPCVFPMIPITVSFFLKQSEKKHHNALLTAGVYSLTIVVVLSAAVLLLGKLIIDLANNPWLNLGLGAVLIFFALSLFGMYEIELPSGLARFTAAREGRGGYIGAVFMALTFTITSFTCTGPFLGPLLVSAKESRLSMDKLVLGAITYSATFAAPFFVMALFPRLLKTLPKSGGWLNGVKVVMGFLELAAALKFLAIMDATLHPGNPWFFNYETVVRAWIALAVACGFYLLGVFRLPHDSPVEHIGVVRMLLASIFLGLALYMTPILWRKTPLGVIGEGLRAFAPQDTAEVVAGTATKGAGELVWLKDYEQAWQQAVKEDKLIFIDFTGVNCQNCRSNELTVFTKADVNQELSKYVRVKLYTDIIPDASLTAEQSRTQARRNSDLQSDTFDEASLPLYVLFEPSKVQPYDEGKLNGRTVGTFAGLISHDQLPAFVGLLKNPDRREVAQAHPAR